MPSDYKAGRLDLEVTDPDPEKVTHVEVYALYDRGSTNYLTGGRDPRGYYLAARPVRVQPPDRPGRPEMRTYALFTGRKWLLEDAARFNRKRLDRLWGDAERSVKLRAGDAWDKVAAFAAEAGVALKPPALALGGRTVVVAGGVVRVDGREVASDDPAFRRLLEGALEHGCPAALLDWLDERARAG